MKNSQKLKSMLSIITVIVASFLLNRIAIASELEEISWARGPDGEDILVLKLDDHPGYVISESGGGSIIELMLKQTTLSENVASIEPRGLVRSSIALSDGDNVKIQFMLSEVGRAKIEPVDEGFTVAINPGNAPAVSGNGAEGIELTGLRFSRVSGNRVQIDLSMQGELKDPAVFKTVSPPRIAFDFFGAKNTSGKSVFPIGISSVDSIVVAEDDNRMRVVLNLLNPVDYNISRGNSGYVLTLGSIAGSVSTNVSAQDESPTQKFTNTEKPSSHSIESVDFRRTPNGGGRIVLQLSDSEVAVDLQERGTEIVALFSDTSIPEELEQRLDVVDFATPVSYIDTYADGPHTKLVITTSEDFTQSSVQSGSRLILDISPLTEAEVEAQNVDEFGYQGERLSLNFQRISVRAALQVIADFTGLNFVTSDAITGNLSLRLKDVPWDQALDVIMQTKGLAMRQKGNVVWVAPAAEITAKEKQALAAKQEKGELEPLMSELIRVSYAKVEDIAKLLKSIKAVETGISQSAFGSVTVNEIKTEENSLLSPRGSVTVDTRTNSILIQDTATKLSEIKGVIAKLDIPVRQVMIETRIVEANDDFSKNIGARLGFSRITQQARFPGASDSNMGDVYGSGNLNQTNQIRETGDTDFSDDALSVNLPAGSIGGDLAGSYAFTIAKLGSGFLSLLDLELSALEAEGKGKILANPKILTTDKRAASIEQGQERLTTFGSAFGTSATEGQKAVLSLSVLPQITPDDKVILDVDITNDSFVAANTNTVNTKRINTQALLENGETVVIGGIYTQDETYSITKVPILGDIPFIGVMFRKKTTRNNRSELLIFLTPRIIDPALAVQ
jgi:type IV pilus assembly protein PilQ